jgi:hypothetical protein
VASTAACFAADARYAVPRRFEDESAERHLMTGDEIPAFFHGRSAPHHRHDTTLALTTGSICLLEGQGRDRQDDRSLASYAAVADLDADGRIRTYLAWGTRTALGHQLAEVGEAPDAADLVAGYMEALDGGAFAKAASFFAEDGAFSRPPGRGEAARPTFRGRAAIQANFEDRGHSGSRHTIEAFAQVGRHGMFTGRVLGRSDGAAASYISGFTLGDGVIADYRVHFFLPGISLS